MTPEEIKALIEDITGKVTISVQAQLDSAKTSYEDIAKKAAEGLMTKEQVNEVLGVLETKVNELPHESLKTLVDFIEKTNKTIKEQDETAKEQGRQIKELTDGGSITNKKEKQGFGDVLIKALTDSGMVEKYIEDDQDCLRMKGYDKMKVGNGISFKAAIDMTTALALSPGSTPGTSIGYLTDYNKMQDILITLSKDIHVVQVLPTDPIAGKYMGVLVEYDYVDGSGTRTEGSASAQSSLKFKTLEYKVFSLSTDFKVSKENLADLPRLASKLNRIAPDRILSTLDGKVFSTGGDNSTDIKGMLASGNMTAFVATTFQDTVAEANLGDLIKKMKLQATNADEDVNLVWLHPSNVDSLELLKGSDKNYLNSRGLKYDNDGNLIRVHGLMVAKNKKLTTDQVVVMWNQAAEIGIKDGLDIEIGMDADDFSKRMRTINFDWRVAFGPAKPGAIIYSSDVESDIDIIDKVLA